MNPDLRLLTGQEVAQLLNISEAQAYRLMGTLIPAVRFGRLVRVKLSDLEDFIQRMTVQSTIHTEQEEHHD